MIDLTNQILCITNNYEYKNSLHIIFSSHHNISVLFIHSIQQAIQAIKSKRYYIILIDEGISSTTTSTDFEQFLSLIASFCMNLNTVIIVPRLNNNCFCKYIKLGFTYIADIETAQYMIPAILEYMEEFKTKRPLPQQINSKGLSIYPKQNTISFKGCKILMSDTWILILLFLVNHGGYCSLNAIQRHIESVQGKNFSDSYIQVNIYRLSKKIKDTTGLKIIKNRYRIGYYLVL